MAVPPLHVLPRAHRCLLVLMMKNTTFLTLLLAYAASFGFVSASKMFLLKKNWEERRCHVALRWIFHVIKVLSKSVLYPPLAA